jgi:mycofactocin glycosyltransferase
VPSAAMVIRRAATTGRCFDERLGAGEDVDLVWRLVSAGWDARYEPTVEVTHTSDMRPAAWLARRALYGSTAGPLALRHGDAVAPARVSPVAAATWGLIGARQPVAAVCISAAGTALLASRLTGVVDDPFALATRLTAVGTARSAAPAVAGMARAWAPFLVLSVGFRRLGRLRLLAATALGVAAARDWRTRPAGLDPARYVAARLADDLAYGSGLWWGCWKARTVVPLVPALTKTRWPGRRRVPAAKR